MTEVYTYWTCWRRKEIGSCKIWNFHGDKHSSRWLLVCDAMFWCGRIPVLRKIILPLSSPRKQIV